MNLIIKVNGISFPLTLVAEEVQISNYESKMGLTVLCDKIDPLHHASLLLANAKIENKENCYWTIELPLAEPGKYAGFTIREDEFKIHLEI